MVCGTIVAYGGFQPFKKKFLDPFDAKDAKSLDVYVTYNDAKRKFALVFSTVVDKEDKFDYGKDVLLEIGKVSVYGAALDDLLDLAPRLPAAGPPGR